MHPMLTQKAPEILKSLAAWTVVSCGRGRVVGAHRLAEEPCPYQG